MLRPYGNAAHYQPTVVCASVFFENNRTGAALRTQHVASVRWNAIYVMGICVLYGRNVMRPYVMGINEDSVRTPIACVRFFENNRAGAALPRVAGVARYTPTGE